MSDAFFLPPQPPILVAQDSHLALEVPVQDAPLMQVLESGKDLPTVVAHPLAPTGCAGPFQMGQGLQRAEAPAPRPLSRPSLRVLAEEEEGSNFGSYSPYFLPTSTILTFRLQSSRKCVYVVSILVVRETHDVAVLVPRCSSISFRICSGGAGGYHPSRALVTVPTPPVARWARALAHLLTLMGLVMRLCEMTLTA